MQSKVTSKKELIKIIEECDYKITEVKNRFVITNCGTELRTEIIIPKGENRFYINGEISFFFGQKDYRVLEAVMEYSKLSTLNRDN